jgi:hypothetical protein
MARIDFCQGLAETGQGGLWRGRAHRNLRICSLFVLNIPEPCPEVKHPQFLLSGEGISDGAGLSPTAAEFPEPTRNPCI